MPISSGTQLGYTNELVLPAKNETVLQGTADRLTEICRFYGMEMHVGKTEVMGISRQLSPVLIIIYLKNSYFGSMTSYQ